MDDRDPNEHVPDRPWGRWTSPSPSISPAQEEGRPPAPQEDEKDDDE